jgi:hypothetical protein
MDEVFLIEKTREALEYLQEKRLESRYFCSDDEREYWEEVYFESRNLSEG